MDKSGNALSSVSVVDSASGGLLVIDEIAWDERRQKLWGCLFNVPLNTPVKVYLVDPTTGSATFQFTSSTITGHFCDGLAYDGSDDSLWISGDQTTTIEHYAAGGGNGPPLGTRLGQITPVDAGGLALGRISGVVAGAGLLYLGQDGLSTIFQVTRAGAFISKFASPGGTLDEGLECDSVNFAPDVGLLSREWNFPGFISAIKVESGTCACGGGVPTAILKVCKVAGTGVAVGTPFTFTAGTSTFTVPAGPGPGGTCVVGPSFSVGSAITVAESIPAGDTVSDITVAPPSHLVGSPNLAAGTVDVTIGSGVTEVTYSDKRTGFLEICKAGRVGGNFTFYVNPGGLGPFVVPAGGCSPAIEVPAGSVSIYEMPTPGTSMVGCATIPPGQQGPCNTQIFGPQTSTVNVTAGDVSAQTIAFVTNGSRGRDTATSIPNGAHPDEQQ
jgi:hypothetical protein